MRIITEYNLSAKEIVRKFKELETNEFVKLWVEETNPVMCVILSNKDQETLSIALLHKMDNDPLKIHTKPILFDYIYTFEPYRKKGYASILLNKIKEKNELTAFCNSEESERLFIKNGYVLEEINEVKVIRHPCKRVFVEISDEKMKLGQLEMETLICKAEELYKVCLNVDEILDPNNWLYNQDKMRTIWEQYKLGLANMSKFMRKGMLNNSYARYMEFMYDNYPAGFGNKLLECYDNNLDCNSIEIFNDLNRVKI